MHDFIGYILSLFQRGLHLAVPVLLLCGAIVAVCWFLFRRQNRPFPWGRVLVLLLLIGWLVLTVFLTLLRGEPGHRQWNMHLFLAWREAWNQFTLQVWLNVLLNIALFLPLGFLLPLLTRWFRSWPRMLLAGLGVSLLIELGQFATARGMLDVDDLFTNTLGAMVGWSISMLILTLTKRSPGWKRRCGALLPIPAALLFALALIFGGYALKPYGNLPDAPVITANLDGIQWELAFTPEDAPATAPIYRAGRLDRSASEAFAAAFAQKLGITFEDTYYYDDIIIFANHTSGDFLNLYQRDGTWEYRIDREKRPVFDVPASQVSPDALLSILDVWGISVPEGAAFALEPSGEAYVQASFTSRLIPADGPSVYGTLTCLLQEQDGASTLTSIENQLVSLTPCEERPILTPAQAVEQLYGGRSFAGTVLEHSGLTQIQVLSCTLEWIADTKGFYQPVYCFLLQAPEGEPFTDYVAALN